MPGLSVLGFAMQFVEAMPTVPRVPPLEDHPAAAARSVRSAEPNRGAIFTVKITVKISLSHGIIQASV
jgi:hypothetical protein